MQELILVGIQPRDRNDEYSPWFAKALVDWYKDNAGTGPEYLAWLVNELKPFIESHYRADGRPESTAIAGKSLGGLISMYAAYLYPQVFGRIGCISGSFWYEGIVEFMQEQKITNLDRRIYIDVGTIEGLTKQTRQREMIPRTHAAHAALVASGFTPDRLKFLVEEGGDHDQPYFYKRFPGALEWLFPGQEVADNTPVG